LKPSVQVLNIHLPGKKIVLAAGRTEALQKVDIPSPVERYLGRPMESSFDQLMYIKYHSQYSVDACPKSVDVHPDVCDPVRFANQRKESILCIINAVHQKNRELFALKLLLQSFPARSWEELRTVEGEICETFYAAVRQLGLVSNTEQEAEICLQDAVDLQRPPSDIWFLLAQVVEHNAGREFLESRLWHHLADERDTVDSVHHKIDFLFHPDAYASYGAEVIMT
jgi:hypothetical protein